MCSWIAPVEVRWTLVDEAGAPVESIDLEVFTEFNGHTMGAISRVESKGGGEFAGFLLPFISHRCSGAPGEIPIGTTVPGTPDAIAFGFVCDSGERGGVRVVLDPSRYTRVADVIAITDPIVVTGCGAAVAAGTSAAPGAP
jgi:hypothetical protein